MSKKKKFKSKKITTEDFANKVTDLVAKIMYDYFNYDICESLQESHTLAVRAIIDYLTVVEYYKNLTEEEKC